MTQLGMMMTGGAAKAQKRERQANDFYPTSPEAIQALILAEGDAMPPVIWEPAAGKGDIVRPIEATGRTVIPSDLVDYDQGYPVQNFYEIEHAPCPDMVTNPPFDSAEEWIAHAFDLGVEYMALLVKSTYWHADRRRALWARRPPQRRYVMTWRIDFLGLGRPTMDCTWYVWRPEGGPCIEMLLGRPEAAEQGRLELAGAA